MPSHGSNDIEAILREPLPRRDVAHIVLTAILTSTLTATSSYAVSASLSPRIGDKDRIHTGGSLSSGF